MHRIILKLNYCKIRLLKFSGKYSDILIKPINYYVDILMQLPESSKGKTQMLYEHRHKTSSSFGGKNQNTKQKEIIFILIKIWEQFFFFSAVVFKKNNILIKQFYFTVNRKITILIFSAVLNVKSCKRTVVDFALKHASHILVSLFCQRHTDGELIYMQTTPRFKLAIN